MSSLELQDDPGIRESVLHSISEKQEKILELSNVFNSIPPESREVRSRKLTPKMAEFMELEKERKVRQLINKFSSKYSSWKELCKKGHSQLKGCCKESEFDEISSAISVAYKESVVTYDSLREISPPEQEIRRQVDTCSAVTKEMYRII